MSEKWGHIFLIVWKNKNLHNSQSFRVQKHTKLSKVYIIHVALYCIYRSPFYEDDYEKDENLFMAKSAKYSEWYHKTCLKIPSRAFTKKVSRGNVWDVRTQY